MLRENRSRCVVIIYIAYCVVVSVECGGTENRPLKFVHDFENNYEPHQLNMNNDLGGLHNFLSRQMYKKSLQLEERNKSHLTDESLGALKIISLLPTSYGKVWRSSSEENPSIHTQFTKRTSRIDFNDSPRVQHFDHTEEGTAVMGNSNTNEQQIPEHKTVYTGSHLPTNKKYEFKHQMEEQPDLMETQSEDIPLVMSYKQIDGNGNKENFHTYWLHSRITPSRTDETNLTGHVNEHVNTHEYVYVLEDSKDSKRSLGKDTRRVWFDPKFSQNHQWQDQKYPQVPERTQEDSHFVTVESNGKLSDGERGIETAGLNVPHPKIIPDQVTPIIYSSHESKVFAMDTGRYTSNFKVIQENKRGTIPSFTVMEPHEETISPPRILEGNFRTQEKSHVTDAGTFLQTDSFLPHREIKNIGLRNHRRPIIPQFRTDVAKHTTHWKNSPASDNLPSSHQEQGAAFSKPKLETHLFRHESGVRQRHENFGRPLEYNLGPKKRDNHSRPRKTKDELRRVRPSIAKNKWHTKGAVRVNPEAFLGVSGSEGVRKGGHLWVRARDVLMDRSTDYIADQKSLYTGTDDYEGVHDRSTTVRRQSVEEKYGSIVAGAAVAMGLAAFAVSAMGNSPMAKESLDILPSLGTLSDVFREADKRIADEKNNNLSKMEPEKSENKVKQETRVVHPQLKVKRKNAGQKTPQKTPVTETTTKSIPKESETKKKSVVLETIHDKKSSLNRSSNAENLHSTDMASESAERNKNETLQDIKINGNLRESTFSSDDNVSESFMKNSTGISLKKVFHSTTLKVAESVNGSVTSLINFTNEYRVSSPKPRTNATHNNNVGIVTLYRTENHVGAKSKDLNVSRPATSTSDIELVPKNHKLQSDPESATRGFTSYPDYNFNATEGKLGSQLRASGKMKFDVRSSDMQKVTTPRSSVLKQPSQYTVSTWIPVLNSKSLDDGFGLLESTSDVKNTHESSYFGTFGLRKVFCALINCEIQTKRKRSVSSQNPISYFVDKLFSLQHDGSRAVDSEAVIITQEKRKAAERETEKTNRGKREANETHLLPEQNSRSVSSKLIPEPNEKLSFELSETNIRLNHSHSSNLINQTSPRRETLPLLQNKTSHNFAPLDVTDIGPADPHSGDSALESRIEVYGDDRGRNLPGVRKHDSGNYSVTTQSQAQVLSPTSRGSNLVTPATLFTVPGRSHEGDYAEPLRHGTLADGSFLSHPTEDDGGRRKWAKNLSVEKLMTDVGSSEKNSELKDGNFEGKKENQKFVTKNSGRGNYGKNQGHEIEEKVQQNELKRIIEKYHLSKFIKELYERKRMYHSAHPSIKENGTQNQTANMNSSVIVEKFSPEDITFHEADTLRSAPNNSVITSREFDFHGHVRAGSMPHKILLFLLEQYKEKLDQIRKHAIKPPNLHTDEPNHTLFSEDLPLLGRKMDKKNNTVIGTHFPEGESTLNENEGNSFETNKLYAITEFSAEDDPVLEELIVLERDSGSDLSHERFQRKLTPEEKKEAQGVLALFNIFLQKNLIRKRSPLNGNNNHDHYSASGRFSSESMKNETIRSEENKNWESDSSSEHLLATGENGLNSRWKNLNHNKKTALAIATEDDSFEDLDYSPEIPEYYYYYTTENFKEGKQNGFLYGTENKSHFDSMETKRTILEPESLMKILMEMKKLSRELEGANVDEGNGANGESATAYLNSLKRSPEPSRFRSFVPAEMSAEAFEEFVLDLSKSLNKHNEWSQSSDFPPVEVSIPSVREHDRGQASQIQSGDGTQPHKSGRPRDFITHHGVTSAASGSLGPDDDREIAKKITFSNAVVLETRDLDHMDGHRFDESFGTKHESNQSENEVYSNYEGYETGSREHPLPYYEKLNSDLPLSTSTRTPVFTEGGFLDATNLSGRLMNNESSRDLSRNLSNTSNFLDSQESTGKKSGERLEFSNSGGSSNSSGFGVSSLFNILNPNKPDILRNINKVLDLIIGDPVEKDAQQSADGDTLTEKYPLPTVFDFPKSRSAPFQDEEIVIASRESQEQNISSSEEPFSPPDRTSKNNFFPHSVDQMKNDIERSLFSPNMNEGPTSNSESHAITMSEETDTRMQNSGKISSLVRSQFGSNVALNESLMTQDNPSLKFPGDGDSYFNQNERDKDIYHEELFSEELPYDDYLLASEEEMDSSERPFRLLHSLHDDGLFGDRRKRLQNYNYVQPPEEFQHLPTSRGAVPNAIIFKSENPAQLQNIRRRADTFLVNDYDYANSHGQRIGNGRQKNYVNNKIEIQGNKDLSLKPSILLTAQRLAPPNRREYDSSLPSNAKLSGTMFNPSNFDVQYFNSSGQWRAINNPSISKSRTHSKFRSNQPFAITPADGIFNRISIERKLETETNKDVNLPEQKTIPSYYDQHKSINPGKSDFSSSLSQNQKGHNRSDQDKIVVPHLLGRNSNQKTSTDSLESILERKYHPKDSLKLVSVKVPNSKYAEEFLPLKQQNMRDSNVPWRSRSEGSDLSQVKSSKNSLEVLTSMAANSRSSTDHIFIDVGFQYPVHAEFTEAKQAAPQAVRGAPNSNVTTFVINDGGVLRAVTQSGEMFSGMKGNSKKTYAEPQNSHDVRVSLSNNNVLPALKSQKALNNDTSSLLSYSSENIADSALLKSNTGEKDRGKIAYYPAFNELSISEGKRLTTTTFSLIISVLLCVWTSR